MIDELTPTQRAIYAILSDGLPHPTQQLMGCLNDEMAARICLQNHLSQMRKTLRKQGLDVFHSVGKYRLVRLISWDD